MEKEDYIVDSLKAINQKLEKHDDKFDLIATSLEKLIKLDTENAEIKSSLTRAFKKIEVIEQEHKQGGCPAHKDFLKTRDFEVKTWHKTAEVIETKLDDLSTRVSAIEDTPMKIAKTIANRVLFVFGTALGGWLLYKFGFTIEEVQK